jgi:5-formyltetrahydrofolate cyclo-ligase
MAPHPQTTPGRISGGPSFGQNVGCSAFGPAHGATTKKLPFMPRLATSSIFSPWWTSPQNTSFCCPRIELGDDRKGMIFLPFSAGLEEGPHGVKQPPKGIEVAPDIVVLPLLGMDQQGVRLGYGGGYYDRKLALLPHVHRVGVGFATQLVASLPRAAHDMGLDMMVTDLGILDVDRGALF